MPKVVFMTKKQRALMRERRRKKKLAEKGISVETTQEHNKKKRSRDDDDEQEETTNTQHNNNNNSQPKTNLKNGEKSDNGPIVIKVPANLSSKDAKKFRKDSRRKIRKEGKDETKIHFVEEGQEPSSSSQQPDKKKHKRSFPRINELVEQEKKQREEIERKKALENISDEYKSRYVALDCEMVGIGKDGRKSVLARVSITNWDGDVILDTYVQVPIKVTDYRTYVSGIKPYHINKQNAIEPKVCREKVATIIKDKILIGHAIKNDLNALMLTHSNVRDTAYYKPFQKYNTNKKKWLPRKLRDLVKEYCNIIIQKDGESHDSIDDAKAVMELYKSVHIQWEKEIELKASKK